MIRKTILGIDPGLDGGLAIISPGCMESNFPDFEMNKVADGLVGVIRMPTVTESFGKKGGSKRDYDWSRIAVAFTAADVVVIERQQAFPGRLVDKKIICPKCQNAVLYTERQSQGAVSIHTSATSYGRLLGIAQGLGTRLEIVAAQTWQKEHNFKKGGSKDGSIAVATRLFPTVSLVPPRGRTSHHGLSDALLIANYGARCLQ